MPSLSRRLLLPVGKTSVLYQYVKKLGCAPAGLVEPAGVDGRCHQVVGDGHGVDIAGQVEVEFLHRDDLRIPAAGGPPLIPKVGPMEGWRIQVKTGLPRAVKPWESPMVVMVLPSPSGVGLMAVTTTYFPLGRSVSVSRISKAGPWPYIPRTAGGSGLRCRPARATSAMGATDAAWEISRSLGNCAGLCCCMVSS